MRIPIRRHFTRALAAGVAMAGVTIAAALVPVATPRSGALAWAGSLSPGHRLAYAQPDRLPLLPVEYRRAIFETLSTSDERAAFWRGVFTHYKGTHDLSLAQTNAIAQAESLLTVATFSAPSEEVRGSGLADIRATIVAALGPGDARELFATAGPAETGGSQLGGMERFRFWWRRARLQRSVRQIAGYIVPPLLAASCNCASDDDCSYYQTCSSPFSCSQTSWGCGSWWLEDCTQLCSYDEN